MKSCDVEQELQLIVEAWPDLTGPVKVGILAMIRAATK